MKQWRSLVSAVALVVVAVGCGEGVAVEEQQVGQQSQELSGEPIVALWNNTSAWQMRVYANGTASKTKVGDSCWSIGAAVWRNLSLVSVSGTTRTYRGDRSLGPCTGPTWQNGLTLTVTGSGSGSVLNEPYGQYTWTSW
jgi:hypothetical protein